MADADHPPDHSVLSKRTIVTWAVALPVLTVASIVTLWLVLGSGAPHASLRIEIIRTAFSIALGGGGAAGLLLAARRQRATELDVARKDHDATETRVTELYGRAADQLGSEKAPVRLAGMFALERLAQEHAEHRQTIVDLLCAYLRMPFDPDAVRHDDGSQQELEVRATAQGILAAHLRALDLNHDPEPAYWPDIRLNLAGATLSTFTFTRCTVHSASFAGARFGGPAIFRGTEFTHNADFRNVRFTGLADFRRVSFQGEGVTFRGARFEGEVDFGTHTVALLTGALAREQDERRRWPSGWWEQAANGDSPGWVTLVRSS